MRYSELTSLLDVLFILVFAALVQAAGLVDRARRAPPDAPSPKRAARAVQPPKPTPFDPMKATATSAREAAVIRRQAAASLVAASARAGIVRVEVSSTGHITRVLSDIGGKHRANTLSIPLLERVSDPNIGVAYLGHRSPALRVCSAVRRSLGGRDLNEALIIIRTTRPLRDLPVALVEGLRSDQRRCYREERGLAVLVDTDGKRQRTTP